MEPFNTGIIRWGSLTGHGAGDAFFCTSLIVYLRSVTDSPDRCVRLLLEVIPAD